MKEINTAQIKNLKKLIDNYYNDFFPFSGGRFLEDHPGLFVSSRYQTNYSRNLGKLVEGTTKLNIILQDEHGKSILQMAMSPTYLAKMTYYSK